MKRYLLAPAFLVFLAWRISHAINTLTRPNLPSEYFSTASGPKNASRHCHVLHAPDRRLAFCEDLAFWDFEDMKGNVLDRKVVASCDPARKNWNTVMGPLRDPNPRGALWLVEFDDKTAPPRMLKLEGYPEGRDFHPLGVGIWPSKAGSTSNMFVINHGRHNSTIEQFSLDPSDYKSAKYIRTITFKRFISPNALALTSPTSFFLSNDHLMTRRLPYILGKTLPVVETFLGLPLGFIGHVSIINDAIPEAAIFRHTIPKLGLSFPNGLALSTDGRTLAVASSSYARVHLFTRTQNADGTESLAHAHTVSVPFAPDNMHYDDAGALVVAGHPFYPGLVAVAANKTNEGAPSWVVVLKPRDSGEFSAKMFDLDAPFPASQRVRAAPSHELSTIYQSDGTKFHESTTGLRDVRTDALIVSGLYGEGLLICRP